MDVNLFIFVKNENLKDSILSFKMTSLELSLQKNYKQYRAETFIKYVEGSLNKPWDWDAISRNPCITQNL